jgi:pyridoxal phosphate enzyme (YggS family)
MLSIPQNSPYPAQLRASIAALRRRIASAAEAAGRNSDTITLLAVSKGHPVEALAVAHALGLADFGENYLDEALPKIAALAGSTPAPRWHFIGRIQANKTRDVAAHFDWAHGVDRLRVAERLAAQRTDAQAPLNVCVQVNVAAEASKAGLRPDEVARFIAELAPLPRLRVRGLMCMLPYGASVTEQAAGFGAMRQLLERLNRDGAGLDTLSMGMSNDLEAAIEQGATLVRVGTALFGAR